MVAGSRQPLGLLATHLTVGRSILCRQHSVPAIECRDSPSSRAVPQRGGAGRRRAAVIARASRRSGPPTAVMVAGRGHVNGSQRVTAQAPHPICATGSSGATGINDTQQRAIYQRAWRSARVGCSRSPTRKVPITAAEGVVRTRGCRCIGPALRCLDTPDLFTPSLQTSR